MRETMRDATDVAVTLALTVDELRTLLADNTDLVRGLFATLATEDASSRGPVQPTSSGQELGGARRGAG